MLGFIELWNLILNKADELFEMLLSFVQTGLFHFSQVFKFIAQVLYFNYFVFSMLIFRLFPHTLIYLLHIFKLLRPPMLLAQLKFILWNYFKIIIIFLLIRLTIMTWDLPILKLNFLILRLLPLCIAFESWSICVAITIIIIAW